MPSLRDAVLHLLPRRWREEAIRESRLWRTTCRACNRASTIWERGGLRRGGASKRVHYLRCPDCGRPTPHDISRD